MRTKITNIKKQHNNITNVSYYVIYFDFYGVERFTYINKRVLEYWKNKGLNKLKIGLYMNVSKISDKHFKIIGFENVTF